MKFQPDYRHIVEVMHNRRPARLPIYEHVIDTRIMEKILDTPFAELKAGNASDQNEFFQQYCRFFREMTYDVVSYEVCLCDALPGKIALSGGQGPIQSRADFDAYPWDELSKIFWTKAGPRFDALSAALPPGMKAVGGIGNGVFELAESLVGLEYLPFMEADDPALFGELFRAIGGLMCSVWREFMRRYSDSFAACRFGDDLGFKSSLLTHPEVVRRHIMPQYRRVIEIVHAGVKQFLWHSCGCVFEVMEDAIAAEIDAKHSNEDLIAPFDLWIEKYGDRIGLLGGFDIGVICSKKPDAIRELVLDAGSRFRRTAKGYALGSGNSIPDYTPVENYLAMIEAANQLR